MSSVKPDIRYRSQSHSAPQNQTNDLKRLASGAGIATAGRLVGRGLNFFVQVVLARLLGPAAFGLYVIGWTFIRVVSMIGPLGLDQGAIRFGTKYWKKDQTRFRETIFFSSSVSLISGILIGLGLFMVAPFLAETIFKKPGLVFVFRSFALAMPLVTSLRVTAAITTISQKLKFATLSEDLLQPASELFLIVVFYLLLRWKLEGAVLAGILSFLIALILAIYYCLKLYPELLIRERVSFSFQRELMAFAFPIALAGLFGSSIQWVDRLLVGIFLSEAETGIYTTVSLVSVVFATILSGIKVIIAPMVASLHHQDEHDRIEVLYRVSTKWGTYISIPLILVVFFTSQELLAVSFGEAYLAGQSALLVLTCAQFINIFTGASDMILVMTGYQKTWLIISAITLGINILLNSLLIPTFGLIGAAIGTALTITSVFLLGLFQVKRKLNLWPYDRRYLKGLVATLITIVSMMLFSLLNISSPFLTIIGLVSLSIGVFSISLFSLKLDPEDEFLLLVIKKRF